MNQLIAIALGGAFGAVMRFWVSSGVYQWLGRDFPYGTLAVNVIGSFMLGLSTEALIIQRVAIATEYRSAIFIGFIGAFTTFSTFALETVSLIEQDAFTKALLNIFASVLVCMFAVALGLLMGRYLFLDNGGVIQWRGGLVPYALILVNLTVAFLVGLILGLILPRVNLAVEHYAAIVIVCCGLYLILSGLYVVLYLLGEGYLVKERWAYLIAVFTGNTLACLLAMGLAWVAAKQV